MPICKCGALVANLDQKSVTDTGVYKMVGRCQDCHYVVKYRMVLTPEKRYLMCDYFLDAKGTKLRKQDETSNSAQRSSIGRSSSKR